MIKATGFSSTYDARMLEAVQRGDLNREEFLSLSKQQNAIAQVTGIHARDGFISDRERQARQLYESRLQSRLEEYCRTDSHPATPMNYDYVPETSQNRFLFDAVRSGKLDIRQAASLRQQMSSSQYDYGKDSYAHPDRAAQLYKEQLSEIWAGLLGG